MNRAFRAPRAMLERKAVHGQPCTNCGLCCVATQCALSLHVFGKQPGPCPALLLDILDDGAPHSMCGLVSEAVNESQRKAALLLIFAGRGCDARFNGEKNDQAFTDRLNREDAAHPEDFKAAWQLWGKE